MGIAYNTSIVRDGLVLHLDAANVKSYPGSGNTWSDLSGNEKDGVLNNNPTYSSNNNGYFSFNGSTNYTALPTNFFSFPSLNTFTISVFFKSSQTTGGPILVQQNTNNPSSASAYVPVIYLRSDGYIRYEPFWTGSGNNFILSSSSLNNDIWHNIVATYDSGTCNLYVDGIFNSTLSGLSLSSFTTTYYYFISAGESLGGSNGRSLGTNYFSGDIANFVFYENALTEAEIKQNFEALRGRYGI